MPTDTRSIFSSPDSPVPPSPVTATRSPSTSGPDGGRRFIKKAMAVPMLGREEEQELARRWRDDRDEESLHKLTAAHMRLVISMAGKYRRFGLPFDDLVQEGNIGLMKAAERFEPERDLRFSTYVSWWIRSCIQDYVLRNWSIVRTGTTSAQKSLFFNLRRLRTRIGDLGSGRLPPEARAEIARELGVREQDVDTMSDRLAAGDRSLNAPTPNSENETSEWQDLLQDEAELPEETVMARNDSEVRKAWLNDAMQALDERESFIIRERRLQERGVTLEALGTRLGISKERVRQIEVAAFSKLRNALESRVGDPYDAELIPAE